MKRIYQPKKFVMKQPLPEKEKLGKQNFIET